MSSSRKNPQLIPMLTDLFFLPRCSNNSQAGHITDLLLDLVMQVVVSRIRLLLEAFKIDRVLGGNEMMMHELSGALIAQRLFNGFAEVSWTGTANSK
jgi:hypothetical protein